MQTSQNRHTFIHATRPVLWQLLLACLSGVLLPIAFLDHQQYWLTWLALVPLLFALENTSVGRAYVLGLLMGGVTFVLGMYWILDFIRISKGLGGAIAWGLAAVYWFYCAQLFAIFCAVFRWVSKHSGWPLLVLFPLLLTLVSTLYPMLFAMRLSESQVNFTVALQAIEWLGAGSLDYIIALANALAYTLLRGLFKRGSGLKPIQLMPGAAATLILICWFAYGAITQRHWNSNINTWPKLKVGVIQPNEVPRIGKKIIYPGFSHAYPPEMEMTERLGSLGAEIVIWPEGQNKSFFDSKTNRRAYQARVNELGIGLVFQDIQPIVNPAEGPNSSRFEGHHSTAVMLNESNKPQLYQKMKRIPFGEYAPLVSEGSRGEQLLVNLFGDFLTELVPGQQRVVFEHAKVNLLPLICYETTFPRFVAELAALGAEHPGQGKASILLGLSNDGWFGSTQQPYQHIMPSVLRAVENRLPFVHVANNGPSIAVSPAGEVVFKTQLQQAGGYILDLAYPGSELSSQKGGSFFSRHPRVFDVLLYLLGALAIVNALVRSKENQ